MALKTPLERCAETIEHDFRQKVKQYKIDENHSIVELSELCEISTVSMVHFLNNGKRKGKTGMRHSFQMMLKISLGTGIPLVS